MPYVYKSYPVEVLDRFFARSPDLGDAYHYSLELLSQQGVTLAEITAQLAQDPRGMEDVAPQAGLFRTGWLEGELGEKRVEVIMRRAYEHAIGLATEGNTLKPIETFWVTGAGDDFEMHVCNTQRRVTVFVCVPRPETGSDNAVSQSWKISTGANGEVTVEQVSGPGREK